AEGATHIQPSATRWVFTAEATTDRRLAGGRIRAAATPMAGSSPYNRARQPDGVSATTGQRRRQRGAGHRKGASRE
ncbi:MAG: hypothetical protein ACE5JX_21145, partial [Acidobacteriota bacterium]